MVLVAILTLEVLQRFAIPNNNFLSALQYSSVSNNSMRMETQRNYSGFNKNDSTIWNSMKYESNILRIVIVYVDVDGKDYSAVLLVKLCRGKYWHREVGIILHKNISKYITNFMPLFERIILIQINFFPISKRIPIIRVYAPTFEKSEWIIEAQKWYDLSDWWLQCIDRSGEKWRSYICSEWTQRARGQTGNIRNRKTSRNS